MSRTGRRAHSMRRYNRKKRRYRRIRNVMLLILLILLGILGFLIVREHRSAAKPAKTETDGKQNAGTASGDPDAEAQDESSAQEEAEKEAEAAAKKEARAKKKAEKAARTNHEVQTAENTATEEHHKTNGLAICMYHYVYDKDNPPEEEINNNFIEVDALEKELQYLTENDYYFPTWEEVKQYVEGDLLLPEKSVVLTFDDGAYSFLNLGVPLFNKYKVPVTSFLIGNIDGEKKVKKYASEYLTFQSHSYNMHRGGGNIGHGGIFPVMDHDEAVADLKKSIEIGGNADAFAYPYGDYNDSCIQAVRDAGFKCAVTTEYGRAKPGDDPLLLPRVRMLEGQSLDSFISCVE